jgi:hypothetical protein
MSELASNAARKAMALVVLLAAAYLLFKLVLGFVTAVVWIAVVVLAVVAVIWAIRTL